ncbi:MAG: hypothetical protein JSW71_03320 [Gemmatimonadota bacterium]|nr:MAG: hypothetical protein JSW71_03320 [Gemmatimonadota bacterium]
MSRLWIPRDSGSGHFLPAGGECDAITNEQDLRDGLVKVAALRETTKRQAELDQQAIDTLIGSLSITSI